MGGKRNVRQRQVSPVQVKPGDTFFSQRTGRTITVLDLCHDGLLFDEDGDTERGSRNWMQFSRLEIDEYAKVVRGRQGARPFRR
jgi:hypothetical protein